MAVSRRNITKEKVGQDALARALRIGQDYFRRSQHREGYWCGQLESNTTMEAEYLMLAHFLGRVDPERWRKLANYILSKQRDDGSWGQYFDSPGDLSTSIESYFALKLAGYSADSEPLCKARQFILSRGGVPQVRVFTKIWLALFGQWDWRGTPNMPPELIFLPSWAPFNLYRFASWARATVAPMLIILTRHPTCPVPESANIDELYPEPRNPRRLLPAQARRRLGLGPVAISSGPFRRPLQAFAPASLPAARRAQGSPVDIGPPGGRRVLGGHPASVGILPYCPPLPGRGRKRRCCGEGVCRL